MKYKLIACDIDGTLLTSSEKLTEKNRQAIISSLERGVKFVISSGRPPKGISPILNSIGVDISAIIAYHGAQVYVGTEKIYQKNLLTSDIELILEAGKKFDTTIIIWTDNKLFANKINEKTKKYSSIVGFKPSLLDENALNYINEGVIKILFYDEVLKINNYKTEMEKIISENVNCHTSRNYFLEFVHKNASKGYAMEVLGKYFDISRDEMIAIGDGYNDISMITYAGLGVAMANSDENIKNIADFVTLSNDNDGVAYVINKFILNE